MEPAKFFTPAILLSVAVFSVVAAITVAPLVETQPEFFTFEMRVSSSKDGRAQLFRDSGAGFSEANSSWVALLKSETPLRYRLPLAAGTYRALRFDPIEADGTIRIAAPPRIVAKGGRILRQIKFSEMVSTGPNGSLHEGADGLQLVVPPGASDPQLRIAFSPPLELRSTWKELIALRLAAALGIFAVLAALLFSLDRRPRSPEESRWQRALCCASRPPLWFTLALVGLVACARRPDAISNPQFWGEDSIVFYRDAFLLGPAALLEPYVGYLHAVPRLVAAASIWFDPRWAPAFFTMVAFASTLYVAARTQSSRSPLPRHAGCALAIVLVPDAFEVLLTIDNVQWILAGGFALLLISADARRWPQLLHDGVAALVFGLTGPFSILFAPLFLWRAWRRRSRASIILALLVVIAAATQAGTLWRNPVAQDEHKIASEAFLLVPGIRVGGSLLLGAAAPQNYPNVLAGGLGIITLVIVALFAAGKGTMRLERIWLGLTFIGLLMLTLYRLRYELPVSYQSGLNSRYFFTLQLFVIWLLLAAAADHRRWLARSAVVLLLWSLVLNVPRLREEAFQDLHWAHYAAKIRAGEAVEVPVNPRPWVMSLPATARN